MQQENRSTNKPTIIIPRKDTIWRCVQGCAVLIQRYTDGTHRGECPHFFFLSPAETSQKIST